MGIWVGVPASAQVHQQCHSLRCYFWICRKSEIQSWVRRHLNGFAFPKSSLTFPRCWDGCSSKEKPLSRRWTAEPCEPCEDSEGKIENLFGQGRAWEPESGHVHFGSTESKLFVYSFACSFLFSFWCSSLVLSSTSYLTSKWGLGIC